jgi:hypothetical protein
MSGEVGAGVRVCAIAPCQANNENASTEASWVRARRYETVIKKGSEGEWLDQKRDPRLLQERDLVGSAVAAEIALRCGKRPKAPDHGAMLLGVVEHRTQPGARLRGGLEQAREQAAPLRPAPPGLRRVRTACRRRRAAARGSASSWRLPTIAVAAASAGRRRRTHAACAKSLRVNCRAARSARVRSRARFDQLASSPRSGAFDQRAETYGRSRDQPHHSSRTKLAKRLALGRHRFAEPECKYFACLWIDGGPVVHRASCCHR